MDEVLLKSGQWPNIAEPAGSDPAEVMRKYGVKPKQSTAATLGRGTCENEWAQFGKFRCSECWLQVDSISTNTTAPIPIKHCPNCGAKVVEQ